MIVDLDRLERKLTEYSPGPLRAVTEEVYNALPGLIAELKELRAFRDEIRAFFEPMRPAGYPPFPETLCGMKFYLEEKFPGLFGSEEARR